MSVINDDYFQKIQNKIAKLHNVDMSGGITSEYEKVNNRAALIFSLEAILDEHRDKYGHITSPLKGKLALEHLLLKKYSWPLSEIRKATIQDSIFLLQEELALDSLPKPAMYILLMRNAHRSNAYFESIREDEWDPELYLSMLEPKPILKPHSW